MKKSYEMDMCHGSLFKKLLIFAIPLMLSGILQLLFNAADMVIVGKFSGSHALAAVGSTSALINLLVNVFIGLSVGTNVLIAQYYGAKDGPNVSETVHTSVLISLISGSILILIGVILAKPILKIMGTPDDVIEHSVLYIRIYFLGMPVTLLYNFGAAILRAIGDTKRPLYFLFLAGVLNVILNLIFVIVFDMGVAGVALATVISQMVSAYLVVRCLMFMDGMCRLNLRKLHIYKDKLKSMFEIGLPAGMQGAVFSLSNMLIQSSVNSFGAVAMAGNTAASNIEGFAYNSMNAVHQTALSFTSQNIGAKNYKRLEKIMKQCLLLVSAIGIGMGAITYIMGESLLSIYSSEIEVIQYGFLRLQIFSLAYFLWGIMDTMVGILRGMGYSIMPMIVSLTGVCGFRVLWVFTIFAWKHSLFVLYISYPISWFITAVAHIICYQMVKKRIFFEQKEMEFSNGRIPSIKKERKNR